MKVCKLKPDINKCLDCLDYQITHGVYFECQRCDKRDDTYYEIIKEGRSLFGERYVVIKKNGTEVKVRADRVYDVKEVIK